MPITFGLLGSLGFAKLLSLSVSMTGGQPSVSWSPDSRWICYTVVEPRAMATAPSDWIFVSPDLNFSKTLPVNERPNPTKTSLRPEASVFRIWATQAGSPQASALFEESDGPLGSPAWRPDGKAVAYMRFVPSERAKNRLRGRFEVVVKEGLDRRRVLYNEDNLEVDEADLGKFCASSPAWNRDATSLAVTRPTGTSAVLILEVRTGKLIRTVENASEPVWSPNGSRLVVVRAAAVKSRQDTIVLVDNPFTSSMSHVRTLLTEEEIIQAPIWLADGQSILAVYRKTRTSRSSRGPIREIMLGRVSSATGDKLRESALSTEPHTIRNLNPQAASPRLDRRPTPNAFDSKLPRATKLPGCLLDFHPETEECFYTTETNGVASVILCRNFRTEVVHKNFPPLDVAIGVGALAIAPDGHTLAIRFHSTSNPELLSTPAFCDVVTGALTIPVANESIRIDWLSRVIRTTETLVSAAIPTPAVPGLGIGQRPILLPVPGELTAGHPLAGRIRRLALLGQSLSEGVPNSLADADADGRRAFLAQSSLYFDYLAGNMNAAETALNDLENTSLTPQQRTALLGIRSQILMAKGDHPGSLAIVDYLTDQEPSRIRTVEETPAGPQIQDIPNPRRIWGNYLSRCHDELIKTRRQQERVAQPDEQPLAPPRPADMFDELNREIPAVRMPFIPFDPDAKLFIEPPVFVRP